MTQQEWTRQIAEELASRIVAHTRPTWWSSVIMAAAEMETAESYQIELAVKYIDQVRALPPPGGDREPPADLGGTKESVEAKQEGSDPSTLYLWVTSG